VATTLKAKEQEELVERLEDLEEALEQRKGEHRYGA
jgi:tetrahydromethanopterin S-methyltransferase subunit G